MNHKKITLDTERKSFESIIAMQGDNKSRYIDATIVNRSIPVDLTGCTVKFSAIKPDLTDIFNNATITDAKGGKVQIELTNQTLAKEGVIQATLVILKEDMQLSVLPFFITVIENPYNPNAIESKPEYQALNNALIVADGYAKELQDASVNLEEKYTTRLNNFGSQLDNIAIQLQKSNGVDDTKMFQEAIDKVNYTNGGRIYIPSGEYYVDSVTINKLNATKIIFEGQAQKTDYFNAQDETVKINAIGSNTLIETHIPVYFEGISFIGKSKEGICIKATDSKRISLYKCKIYGFDIGLDIQGCIHDIRECEISNNKKGIQLLKSGDSCISDCWINTNTIGVSYGQYCGNSQIKGGKIEWNDKAINITTSGIIISNIQFDYNKIFDINIDGILTENHQFAIHPDNIFSIAINNNRFLGSGYSYHSNQDINSVSGCMIYCNRASEILINGNTFTSGGRWAQDNSGLSDSEVDLLIGPNKCFIKCNESMINVSSNNFNSQYNIPPVIVVDTNEITSEVQFEGNRNLNSRKNLIYDYSTDIDLNKKQTVFYSTEINNKVFINASKPILGTFNMNDKIYNDYSIINQCRGWICTDSGTIRETNNLQVTSNVDTNKITLSRNICANELKVGDYLYLGEKLKVTRIVYKDNQEDTLIIPDVFVDKTITVNYSGAINFYKPTFIEFEKINGNLNISNEDMTINSRYSMLNIASDKTIVNITFNDNILYDGFEFLIRCAWVINKVVLRTQNLGNIGEIPSSSTGWWKVIYYNNKFKLIQNSSDL